MWPPGIPGLAALCSCTLAGLVLSLVSYAWNLFPIESMGRPHARLQAFALTTGMVAVYFWCWALLNSARSHFDLGVVSFIFPLVSSIWLLLHHPTSTQQIRVLRYQKLVAGTAPLFPAANYAFGVGIKINGAPTLVAYFIVGIVWWLLAALIGAYVVHAQTHWLLGGRLRDQDALTEGHDHGACERPDSPHSREGSSSPT